ncbi:MAG TPA: hypothetical protein VHD15_06205 [Hyphomicrobiales bacterium]|nr:hypothetical protein [Hyphomicrobiales bacterium]
MTDAKELAPSFRRVSLHLARAKDHPEGEPDEGYDLLVPLDDTGHLEADTWKTHQDLCRVRHFNRDGETRIGRLRRKPGGQWYFDYEQGESDDEIGFRFGEERFVTGEYVSIRRQHDMLTYRIVRVEKP